MLERLAANSRASIAEGVYGVDGGPRGPRRDLAAAIAACPRAPVIAEIKFSSPSAGGIRPASDPAAIARSMEAGGAVALSVLTQPRLFGGSPANLSAARAAVGLPVLMKDVIVGPEQVEAAARAGADYILLMQSLFDRGIAGGEGELVRRAHDADIGVLIEAHTAGELRRAAEAGADLLGVNNRDLDTLEVDVGTTARVLAEAGGAARGPVVAESGIASPRDVLALRDAGAGAFLVGTGIMGAGDVEGAVRALAEAY